MKVNNSAFLCALSAIEAMVIKHSEVLKIIIDTPSVIHVINNIVLSVKTYLNS